MIVATLIGTDRIQFIGSPRYKELMKQIPGARYDAKTKSWTAPLSWATALAARGVLGDYLSPSTELQEWGWEERARLQEIEKVKAGEEVEGELPAGLRPSQRTGVTFLYTAERAILGDDRGTGKTPQSVCALQLAHRLDYPALPALVIATNSMLFQWRTELEKWWDGPLAVSVVHGTAAQRRKQLEPGADVYVIGWANLRNHSRLAPYGSLRLTEKERTPAELNALQFRTVIADEAHRMKDPKAKQTRAAWALFHTARNRWALTGTPIADTPADLWAIGHGIAPEEYPTRTTFIDRYTLSGMNIWGGLEVYGLDPKHRDEFFGFFDARFLRRTKEEVAPELPAKTYSTRYVEMDTKQARAYDRFAKEMVAELDTGILLATDPLAKLTRLVQLAAGTPQLDEAGNVKALADPSCKVQALHDALDEAPGEPLVVFAASRKLIELCSRSLEKAKVLHRCITGLVGPEVRAESVADFQAGKVQVILATFGAGGEGITLTAASRALFLQRSWSHIDNVQAEDRIHRIGQERPVEIIDVITSGTIEEGIHETDISKSERLQEIVRDPQWLARALKQQGDMRAEHRT